MFRGHANAHSPGSPARGIDRTEFTRSFNRCRYTYEAEENPVKTQGLSKVYCSVAAKSGRRGPDFAPFTKNSQPMTGMAEFAEESNGADNPKPGRGTCAFHDTIDASGRATNRGAEK